MHIRSMVDPIDCGVGALIGGFSPQTYTLSKTPEVSRDQSRGSLRLPLNSNSRYLVQVPGEGSYSRVDRAESRVESRARKPTLVLCSINAIPWSLAPSNPPIAWELFVDLCFMPEQTVPARLACVPAWLGVDSSPTDGTT